MMCMIQSVVPSMLIYIAHIHHLTQTDSESPSITPVLVADTTGEGRFFFRDPTAAAISPGLAPIDDAPVCSRARLLCAFICNWARACPVRDRALLGTASTQCTSTRQSALAQALEETNTSTRTHTHAHTHTKQHAPTPGTISSKRMIVK